MSSGFGQGGGFGQPPGGGGGGGFGQPPGGPPPSGGGFGQPPAGPPPSGGGGGFGPPAGGGSEGPLAHIPFSADDQKKHQNFVERMVAKGYTEKQVRLLSEWYLRVQKSS